MLLRPVVESAALPTVAYVAGPGELTYLAQSAPLYAALDVVPQTPVARWSGVLVEPRVDRVLDKFGATLEELLAPGNALEARVVRSQVPRGLLDAAARLRAALDTEYGAIQSAAIDVDPTLERPVAASRQHALTGLADIEKKVQGHLKKRESTELAQVARARLAVQPEGKPQERVLAGVSGSRAMVPACWNRFARRRRRGTKAHLLGGRRGPRLRLLWHLSSSGSSCWSPS